MCIQVSLTIWLLILYSCQTLLCAIFSQRSDDYLEIVSCKFLKYSTGKIQSILPGLSTSYLSKCPSPVLFLFRIFPHTLYNSHLLSISLQLTICMKIGTKVKGQKVLSSWWHKELHLLSRKLDFIFLQICLLNNILLYLSCSLLLETHFEYWLWRVLERQEPIGS